jgi:hypothetical protein
MARVMPTSVEDMAKIPGLGPWRLKQYGDELLKLMLRWKR